MNLRFAPNLHFMYLEFPFLDRFEKAAEDGFSAVELTFPYETPAEETRKAARDANVQIVEFNTPAGELIPNERRGHISIPGDESIFLDHIQEGIDYALAVKCPQILTLSGLKIPGHEVEQRKVYLSNLKRAANFCEKAGIRLLIEPNNVVDFPGYFLQTMAEVRKWIELAGSQALGGVFDFYHTQINEGDVTRRFRESLDFVSHVQFGDNPGRHQPGTGELNFDNIFKTIRDSGYSGWVGAEYFPTNGDTRASLAWFK